MPVPESMASVIDARARAYAYSLWSFEFQQFLISPVDETKLVTENFCMCDSIR